MRHGLFSGLTTKEEDFGVATATPAPGASIEALGAEVAIVGVATVVAAVEDSGMDQVRSDHYLHISDCKLNMPSAFRWQKW